jgi:AAA family ATP:ADP antiporter
MWIYWWVNKNVIDHLPIQNKKSESKIKKKVSLLEGFKLIAKSPYLLSITILVIGYGLCMTLIEVSWKANVKLLYPSAADFQVFTSKVTSSVGFIAFFISMFFGTNIIRRCGWRFSALISPTLVGGTGILFFLALMFKDHLSGFTSLLGLTPLALIVFLGAFQNISSKVAKYAFFDPTKEMAYIPLSPEQKVGGKAAIEVVGSRLGKSGASWIQIIFLDLFGSGSILSISNLLVPIVVLTTVAWIYSVNHLSKEFSKKTTNPNQALA